MTLPKLKTLGPSGPGALVWFDGELVDQMPDLAPELHGLKIDAEAFAEWLRAPLAQYRVHALAREQMAQRAVVIECLEQAAGELDAAMEDGRLQKLPAWFAEPAVSHAALKRGWEWRALLRENRRAEIHQCLRDAIDALGRQRPNRGRPKKAARDVLLHLVIERLKRLDVSPADAQHRADGILVKCKVPTPEASGPRAARRGRRAISV